MIIPPPKIKKVITIAVAVRPAREWIRATGNLRRQRKEWDFNYNHLLRYNPLAFGAIDVKHELLDIISVHLDVQIVESKDIERNPARLSQIQRGVVDHTSFRLACDQHADPYGLEKKGDAPISGRKE